MPLPPLPDEPSTPWGYVWLVLTGAALTVAGWWKARLVVRDDKRGDRGATTVAEGYERLIEEYRQEIAALRVELREERRLRRDADIRAQRIAKQLDDLDAKYRALQKLCANGHPPE